MPEALPSAGAMRGRRLFQRRIDAGDVGKRQQKGEGKDRDDQRNQHAPIVVGELQRPVE